MLTYTCLAFASVSSDARGPTLFDMETPEGLLLVRATINLPDLRVGEEALVDLTDKYVADCLAARFIVPVEAT